ncbi:hypothetical protein AGOR_G00044220 [Albula goreensis]|uniref:Uncharacterized protein n=1 Tax=Albula goreensis TaxID=1534307 RepID=A0A8T3E6Z0_9TELE|nr:hypothetical protein AGOR_G00044220 [Albula goreensis]
MNFLQQACKEIRCITPCCVCQRVDWKNFHLSKFLLPLYTAMCWVVILFIDGTYFACGSFNTTVTCNTTIKITASMENADIQHYVTLSKVIGFALITVLAAVYLGIGLRMSCKPHSEAAGGGGDAENEQHGQFEQAADVTSKV